MSVAAIEHLIYGINHTNDSSRVLYSRQNESENPPPHTEEVEEMG